VAQFNKYLPIAVAIIIGIFLQGILVLADCKGTPQKAAVEFVKAYYRLDPSMSALLCKKYTAKDDAGVVKNYIRKASKEAGDRGLNINYMKNILYGIETHTHRIDDVTAEVRLIAKRRRSINPVYALIAKFFLIGDTHKVDQLIQVVKEDGKWKVCSSLFSVSGV